MGREEAGWLLNLLLPLLPIDGRRRAGRTASGSMATNSLRVQGTPREIPEQIPERFGLAKGVMCGLMEVMAIDYHLHCHANKIANFR